MGIEEELMRAARIRPLGSEPEQRFLRRLAARMEFLDPEAVESMTPEAFAWANAAVAALKEGSPVPSLKAGVEVSLIEQLLQMLEGEDALGAERRSARSAGPPPRRSPKLELRRSASALTMALYLKDPRLSRGSLAHKASSEGYPISPSSARQCMESVNSVVRAIKSLGWRVIDESGNTVPI